MENLEIGGLHISCDTPGCNYMKPIDQTKVKEFIGLKCPKCDAVLITQSEVDALNDFSSFAEAVNDIATKAGFVATEENREKIEVKITAPKDGNYDKKESRPERDTKEG